MKKQRIPEPKEWDYMSHRTLTTPVGDIINISILRPKLTTEVVEPKRRRLRF